MSEAAIYEFGSKVFCSDADCGELLRVVVDPDDIPRLSQLVVCSVADGAGRLVASYLARAVPYGVLLDCDKSTFDSFPAATEFSSDAQTTIRRGDHVSAMDGDAGRVLGVIVRTEDEAITHVLLAAGHLWHRRHVAIPVDYVAGLGFAGLDVLMTRKQVADFALEAET